MCYKNIKEVLQTGVLQGEVRGYGRDAKARKKEDSKLLIMSENCKFTLKHKNCNHEI